MHLQDEMTCLYFLQNKVLESESVKLKYIGNKDIFYSINQYQGSLL